MVFDDSSNWNPNELAYPIDVYDWSHCNWHGVWVSSYTKKGSYGRISHLDYDPDFPQAPIAFWVNWSQFDPKDKRPSASVHPVEDLKLLPVEPEPWH